MKAVPMCLSRQDGSYDMHHDMLDSEIDVDLDLDLRPRSQFDLAMSSYISFKQAVREKHDGAQVIYLASTNGNKYIKRMFCSKYKCQSECV